MVLFLAVALTLPNYAKAFETDRIESEALRALYETYLVDMGAQEAHAVLPVLAIPASLAAAGVTTETLAAASAAIFTAVAGVSLVAAWEDLLPTDKANWGSKENYIGAQLLGTGILQGWLEPGQPSGGSEQPPEFKGDKGEKVKQALLKLAGAGVGTIALAELAFMAKDLIDFVTAPFGEDGNGYPTGLGYGAPLYSINGNLGTINLVVTDGVTLPDSSIPYKYHSSLTFYLPDYGVWTFLGNLSPNGGVGLHADDKGIWLKQFGRFSECYDPGGDRLYDYMVVTGNPYIYITDVSTLYVTPNTSIFIYGGGCFGEFNRTYQIWDGASWNTDFGTVMDTAYDSSNIPGYLDGFLQQVVQAGVGTESSQQIVNNYVTNNITNSEKVVTVPSSIEDTADYDKVVTDPAPGPGPNPDPDPDNPGGDGETVREKAEKFLKLPVEQLFPFCLVYDIRLLIEHVAGSGVAVMADDSLVFEFDLGFGYFDCPLVIDLTDYRDMQGSFHMFFDVMLVVGLLYFSISLFLKARSE